MIFNAVESILYFFPIFVIAHETSGPVFIYSFIRVVIPESITYQNRAVNIFSTHRVWLAGAWWQSIAVRQNLRDIIYDIRLNVYCMLNLTLLMR